jgi:hypothetical protein
MGEKIISAHVDLETDNLITHIAKMENCPTSEIVEMALKFFTSLPPEAHTSLRQIEAFGSSDDLKELAREITRTMLHAEYKIVTQKIMEHMTVDGLDKLETEDDILQEAVSLTR